MSPQKLIVFKHDMALGNAPAHKLFERVSVKRKSGVAVAREFSDYDVTPKAEIEKGLQGVTVIEPL